MPYRPKDTLGCTASPHPQGEEHSRRIEVVRAVDNYRARRRHRSQVIGHLSSCSAVDGLARSVLQRQIVVERKKVDSTKVLAQPGDHLLCMLEEDHLVPGKISAKQAPVAAIRLPSSSRIATRSAIAHILHRMHLILSD